MKPVASYQFMWLTASASSASGLVALPANILTFAVFQAKSAGASYEIYLASLHALDWHVACACLEGSPQAWEQLFAARAGRSDCLLVDALRLGALADVSRLDATRLGAPPPGASFDLAFADPPYGRGLAEQALASLVGGGWLAKEAIMVLERAAGEAPFTAPGFQMLESRAWGAARVEFLALA